ncbi:MAG TPA: metalloregulator ArsR/SmtB family transcription factor [Candidatus Nanoarchaeia archaeon]|nr:hypothetical protein [uncultured archaeon]
MYNKIFLLEEEVFKVMANQKRLEIIQLLKHQELSVSEMVSMLGIRQANLSQHLALLRQRNLLKVRKDGQKVYYRLADKRIAKAVDFIFHFLESQQRFDSVESAVIDRADIYPIVKDPVCGMRMSIQETFDSTQYAGVTYYFCASGCKSKFLSQPRSYAKKMEAYKTNLRPNS